MNMSHPAAAADAAHSSTDAGVPRLAPWSLPSHEAFSYRSVACVDSDAAVSSRTGAGVGAATGAVVGCLDGFGCFVRFPLATAQTRQRARCGRIIKHEAAKMTLLTAFSFSWQAARNIWCGLDFAKLPGTAPPARRRSEASTPMGT